MSDDTTITSDWGDWLPRAVAEAEPDGLALWYLGCNGFICKSSGGTTLFIDPYLGTGDPPRTIRMIPVPFDPEDVPEADAVLATHEHSDHVDGPSQAPILSNTGATFYAPEACLDVVAESQWKERWDLFDAQFEQVSTGDSFECGDIRIHVEKANDPDALEPVAYVIEHTDSTFVHCGDARPGAFETIGEEYDVDVAAIAFGTRGMIPDKETGKPNLTKWYNDENMLIEAAGELQAETVLPTHWDMWKGLTGDPKVLHEHASSFSYPDRFKVMEIGDRLVL